MSKKVIKISDLLQVSKAVDISDEEQIVVRPLSLKEMMELLMDQTDNFLGLYSLGIEGKVTTESLTPYLIASPQLIAKIIATSMNEPESFGVIETNMAATVQLIALQEIWRLSVPDQKKAQELLSVVTAMLQKLSEKGRELAQKKSLSPPLQMESLEGLNT